MTMGWWPKFLRDDDEYCEDSHDDKEDCDQPEEHVNGVKRCPYCAEEIQGAAIYCRYCDHYLDNSQKNLSQNQEQEEISGWWYFIAFAIPIIGLIAGATYASKPETKEAGKGLVLTSIVSSIIGSLIYYFVLEGLI